jgi:hypothetical protein
MDAADRIAPTLANDPIDSTEAHEPMDATDNAEPVEPIDSTEFLDQRLSTEFSEPIDHFDGMATIMLLGAALRGDVGGGRSLSQDLGRRPEDSGDGPRPCRTTTAREVGRWRVGRS